MDVIVIGDIHGHDTWERVCDMEYDKVVFIGDYFDSFHIDGDTQIKNFKNILKFYESDKENITLLCGNHELGPINPDLRCSGYQNGKAHEIGNLLKPLRENGGLKACKVIGDYLFTHAGVTKTWVETYNIDINNLEKEMNDLFMTNIYAYGFQDYPGYVGFSRGLSDPYGNDVFQSPCWVRPGSLLLDKIDGYTQVVGHTPQKEINFKDDVWFVDCLDRKDEFLTLEI